MTFTSTPPKFQSFDANLDLMTKLGLFDNVIKLDAQKVLKGNTNYSLPENSTHAIVSGNNIYQFCSKGYNLAPNTDIFLPVLETLHANYEQVGVKVSNNGANAFVDFIFNDGKNGIMPAIGIQNGYDGIVPFRMMKRAFRQICSNGMHAFVSEGKGMKKKHTKINDFSPETILRYAETTLNEFGVEFDIIKRLQSIKIPRVELEKQFEMVANGTKFPVKAISRAIERAEMEARETKQSINLWLVYNGLNYILNHDTEYKITESNRRAIDVSIQENVLELAKVI
jgi:hypothetical protein